MCGYIMIFSRNTKGNFRGVRESVLEFMKECNLTEKVSPIIIKRKESLGEVPDVI